MKIFYTLLLALTLFTVNQAHAADEIFAPKGLALKGVDVVAYTTLPAGAAAVKGVAEYKAEHQGATFQFVSQENLDTFQQNPEQFLPGYGGYCAYAMAVKGDKVKIDPNAWALVNGKLYLNYSKGVQKDWLKSVETHIEQADANWSMVKSKVFDTGWF